jgi:hypothetical protein
VVKWFWFERIETMPTIEILYGFKITLEDGQIIRNCQDYTTPEECMKAIKEVTNEINPQG